MLTCVVVKGSNKQVTQRSLRLVVCCLAHLKLLIMIIFARGHYPAQIFTPNSNNWPLGCAYTFRSISHHIQPVSFSASHSSSHLNLLVYRRSRLSSPPLFFPSTLSGLQKMPQQFQRESVCFEKLSPNIKIPIYQILDISILCCKVASNLK